MPGLYIVPPKNIDVWMYEAFRRLNSKTDQAMVGLAAVGRGEAPDGSGLPLVDLSRYFYLPGTQGGQTAYQIDYLAPLLKMTQETYTSTAEPLLILDSWGKLMRMTTQSFDVANCTTTATLTTVTTSGSFLQTNGPSVVYGMLVTGTGIPAGTYVRQLTAGNTIELTQAATANGSVTLTFTTQVDIQPRTDDMGRDIEWLVRGGIRFTAGTSTIPLRITGEEQAIASGIAIAPRMFLEVGYVSGGSAVGTDLQIGGPQHGELAHMNIFARTLWLARSPASGTDNCVGVGGGENPALYGAGFGPAASMIVGNNRGPLTAICTTATGPIFEVRDTSSGTSPNKVLGGLIFGVDRDNSLGFHPIKFENAAGGGAYWRAASDQLLLYQKSNNLEMLSWGRVSTWGDSLNVANSFFMTLGTVNGGHRAYFLASSGFGSFTRFGIKSLYTVIGNGNISSSDFPAPEANPSVLRVINGATGGDDASILVKIQTQRAGQSGRLLQLVSSAGAELGGFSAAGAPFLIAGAGAGKVLVSDAGGVGSWGERWELPYTAQTTTYPITASDYLVDCTSGTFTVTLPTAVGVTGRQYVIKNSGTGTITVATTASQTIDGNTTVSLLPNNALYVASNGANWLIV